MLAFINTTVTKAEIIAQLEAHALADEIVKGVYWQDGKGCAVGCTIHGSDHAEYEPRFGIPIMLARLEDCIFEGMENSAAKGWPLRFMRAVREGSDLSRTGWQLLHWLLTDSVVNPGINHPAVRDAVRQCADLIARRAQGQAVVPSKARAAAEAAWAAATRAWAAWAAEEPTAWAEAWAAAWAARDAAAAVSAAAAAEEATAAALVAATAARATVSAATARAATAAAWAATARAGYALMAHRLIELIETAPLA